METVSRTSRYYLKVLKSTVYIWINLIFFYLEISTLPLRWILCSFPFLCGNARLDHIAQFDNVDSIVEPISLQLAKAESESIEMGVFKI